MLGLRLGRVSGGLGRGCAGGGWVELRECDEELVAVGVRSLSLCVWRGKLGDVENLRMSLHD